MKCDFSSRPTRCHLVIGRSLVERATHYRCHCRSRRPSTFSYQCLLAIRSGGAFLCRRKLIVESGRDFLLFFPTGCWLTITASSLLAFFYGRSLVGLCGGRTDRPSGYYFVVCPCTSPGRRSSCVTVTYFDPPEDLPQGRGEPHNYTETTRFAPGLTMAVSSNAAAPGAIVPAQLGFLAIFNPSLGNTDETIDDQIVYYASVTTQASRSKRRRTRSRPTDALSQEERNERLRQIGLAQGMASFSRGFAGGAAVDAIDTDKSRVVLHELEPGWWILAVCTPR